MHGRLRSPIPQLSLPSAKGYSLFCPQTVCGTEEMIMAKGRNNIVKRPSALILTMVSKHIHPSSSHFYNINPRWPFHYQYCRITTFRADKLLWQGPNSFSQVAPHTLAPWWEMGGARRKRATQSSRAWEGPRARDSQRAGAERSQRKAIWLGWSQQHKWKSQVG